MAKGDLKMLARKCIALLLVLMLSVPSISVVNFSAEYEEETSIDTGLDDLYFKTRDRDIVKELYTMVNDKETKTMVRQVIGTVTFTHNESKFEVFIDPKNEEGYMVTESRVFVSYEPIPLSEDNLPVTALFPFKTNFNKPVDSHLITVDLFNDMGLTWLPEDEDKLLQNVAVFCRVRQEVGKKVTNFEAWAGNEVVADSVELEADKKFAAGTGSWFNYQIKELVFRKNVSRSEETQTSKAKIEVLPVYVPAHRANGDPVELTYRDAYGAVTSVRTEAKPLVAVYAEEMQGCYIEGEDRLARDVYAAVSVDEGSTWKRVNLSRSADRSSFALENGFEYLGDTHKPNIKVSGNKILVAWTSKFARTGTPTYAIDEFLADGVTPNPDYVRDIWGVKGPQRSRDYTEDGFPGLEIPYSVVWVTRGFVDEATGEVTWFKAERLTSGRRDAAQITIAAANNAGFALVWQEDPEGLRPGEQAGPGEGWSGATTNHKTDIWYSYINWNEFQNVDEDYYPNGDPQFDPDDPDKGGGRPKALVQMSLPVRLTDNDTLNTDSMKIDSTKLKSEGEGFWRLELEDLPPYEETVTTDAALMIEPLSIEMLPVEPLLEPVPEALEEAAADELLEAEAAPEEEAQPEGDAVPEAPAAPEEEALPEGEAVPEAPAAPEEVVPEEDPVPEAPTVPEEEVVPEGDAVPEVPVIPEEEAALEEEPAPEEGSVPEGELIEPKDPTILINLDETFKPQLFSAIDLSLSELEVSDEPNGDQDQDGSHDYGYLLKGLLWDDDQDYLRFYETVNNQGVTKYVAITVDGRLMDGDTGASRGNLMLQPYKKSDGSYSAWAVLGYEETKGAGSGPPDEEHEEYAQTGQDDYDPDLGKNVVYHSYDFRLGWNNGSEASPDYVVGNLVSGGEILNPQETDENGDPLFLVDELGYEILDYQGAPVPAYENARRPRFLIQSKANATAGDGTGTVMVALYKMGENGKGRPSDIIMQRWEASSGDTGNPYDIKYLVDEVQNISSVTPVEMYDFINDSGDPQEKMLTWVQTEDNLDDATSDYDNDDARAHRGFIRGDFLAVAYTWTPNWTAARNGNDVYNLYIRRSFDGGETWTTDPDGSGVTNYEVFRIADETSEDFLKRELVPIPVGAGEFEPARNVSLIRNTKQSVIEPRLVGVPGTIAGGYEEDTQDPNAFWVTFGTELNVDTNIPKDLENEEETGGPLDLYYSYSTDLGETYFDVTKIINLESDGNNAGEEVVVWDWLAKDRGDYQPAQAEAQIRMSPDGSVFYAIWNESGYEYNADGSIVEGSYFSDAVFRRILRDKGVIEVRSLLEE